MLNLRRQHHHYRARQGIMFIHFDDVKEKERGVEVVKENCQTYDFKYINKFYIPIIYFILTCYPIFCKQSSLSCGHFPVGMWALMSKVSYVKPGKATSLL